MTSIPPNPGLQSRRGGPPVKNVLKTLATGYCMSNPSEKAQIIFDCDPLEAKRRLDAMIGTAMIWETIEGTAKCGLDYSDYVWTFWKRV